MQMACMEGFEFKIIWESQEDDIRASIIENFKNNSKYFGALDIPASDNIKRFIKSFDVNFENLEDVAKSIKSNANKFVLIITNIDKMVSKEQESFVDFIKGLKIENISVLAIEKNIETVKNNIKLAFGDLITDEYIMPKTNFYDIHEYSSMKGIESFIYYSICGSNKRYIEKIKRSEDVKANIMELFLKKEAIFTNETKLILKEELRSLQVYNAILMAIAKGAETLVEISKTLNLPTSVCNKYTTVLIEQGILIKIKPVYSKDVRKSKYKIRNSLFNFIYYFVFENVPELKLNKAEVVYNEKIEPELNRFLSASFKSLCSEYIEKYLLTNSRIKYFGSWWDKSEKIDIILGDNLEAVVADCFWREEPVGKEEFEELKSKSKNLNLVDRKYYLFSKVGFTEELKKIANGDKDILLIEFKNMFGEKEDKNKKKFFLFKK